MIAPESTWTLWAFILSGSACAIWLETRYSWAGKLSGAVIALVLAMLLSNLRILPTSAPAYDFVGDYLVPLSLPLLLFRANLVKIARLTGKMFLIFHVSAVGTILGALLATVLFNGRIPGIDPSTLGKIAGVMTGSYIGGGINFFGLVATFGLSENIAGPLLVADNFIMAAIFIIMLTLASGALFRQNYPHSHLQADGPSTAEISTTHWRVEGLSLIDLASALAIAFVIVAVAQRLGGLVNAWLEPSFLRSLLGNQYVLITSSSLIAATLFSRQLDSIRGAELMGGFLLYIFLFTIGLPADLRAVLLNLPLLFVFCLVIACTNLAVTLAVGRIFRWNLEEIILCINAALGGSATAAAMAASRGWSRLVLPAVLVGIWGYVIGTGVGIAVCNLLVRWLI